MFEKYIHKDGFVRVPVTGNRYFVNLNGEVRMGDGNPIIQYKDSEGHRYVWGNFWYGLGYYWVAHIMIATYKNIIKLPTRKWRYIEPLYIDGDYENLHPSNLAYRFIEGGLEHDKHPGFYYIPMFTGYAISTDGVLINATTGAIKTCNYRANGYCQIGIANDVTGYRTVGRHRLLCLAFKPYPAHVDKLDVNHLDGVPGNDALDNLEWATRRRNIKHAHEIGLRHQNHPVVVRDAITGQCWCYYGTADCSEAFGKSGDTIRLRLKTGGQLLYDGRYQFKYEDDPTPWRDIDDVQKESRRSGVFHCIQVKDVFSDQVYTFDSIKSCAKALHLKDGIISYKLKNDSQIPHHGYLFRYADDPKEWSVFDEVELETYRRYPVDPPKPVTVIDEVSGEEHHYPSNNEVACAHQVKRDTVNQVLSGRSKRLNGRYLVRYYQSKKS